MANQPAIYWARYGFHINNPAVKPVVEQFTTDEVLSQEQGQLLADLMNEIDKKEGKGQWVSEPGVAEWNFAGAYVVHRGRNSLDYPTKGTMKNVLILYFDPGTFSGPSEYLYIPYND